jgi:hypothetical protein
VGVVELIRAVGRRWYVVVAGLILTGGLVAAMTGGLVVAGLDALLVPVMYEAKASMLLLPPTKTVTETTGNPFLNLGGLDVVSGVLSLSLTDSQTVSSLVPPRSKTTYTVTQDGSVSGSVLNVSVTAVSPREALATLTSIETLASTRLRTLQDSVDAPLNTQARIMTITDNTRAVPNFAALIRALIAVIAAGVVITFLAAIAVDSIARRRKARKVEKMRAIPTDDGVTEPVPVEAESNDGTGDADDPLVGTAARPKEDSPPGVADELTRSSS